VGNKDTIRRNVGTEEQTMLIRRKVIIIIIKIIKHIKGKKNKRRGKIKCQNN